LLLLLVLSLLALWRLGRLSLFDTATHDRVLSLDIFVLILM